jgi:tetratricopeptide (TPR) repeat protein
VKLDDGLVGSFLTALQQFSSKLSSQEGQPTILREVEMKGYTIVYERQENTMVAASADRSDDEKVLRDTLNRMISVFNQRFGSYLKTWIGDTNPFKEFLPEIDKLTLEGMIAELAVPKPLLKKKISKTIVKIGMFVDEDCLKVANLCDGTKSKEEIAQETGFTVEKVGENLEKLEKMGLVEPNPGETYSNLVKILYDKGLLDQESQELRRALRMKPDLAHYNIGNILYHKGLLDEAILEYREALKINPDYADAHTGLEATLRAKGLLDEVIKEHREAIKIKPDLAPAHYNLGAALYDKGLLEEAILEYREAIRIKPDYADAHNNLGVALEAVGDLKGAVEAYQNFIKYASPQYAEHIKQVRQHITELKKVELKSSI